MHPLVQLVQNSLSRGDRGPRRAPLIVAVSGGVDSVVLLHVLHRLGRWLSRTLIVAHAHHGLRNEADIDADFVAALAGRLELRCVTERLPVKATAQQTRESIEMTARRLRHAFLARAAHDQKADQIALAHHAGDQAELFLLRLLRGAGGNGLGGMRSHSPSPADPRLQLIRPLLTAPKELLLDYARVEGLEFREDASNRDTSIPRNQIRHKLLPLLRRDYSPALDSVLNRTANLVGTESDFIQAEAQRWLRARRRKSFGRLHVAVQRAIVREQLWQLDHEADFDLVERLRTRPGGVSVDPSHSLKLTSSGSLKGAASQTSAFLPEAVTVSLANKSGKLVFGGVQVQWTRTPGSKRPRPQPRREVFDAAQVGSMVALRHWRPGDRFQTLGLPKAAKLQNLLVNRKVPAARRRQLLVAVAESGEIFWVEGLPPGEGFKVTPSTQNQLELRWQRLD